MDQGDQLLIGALVLFLGIVAGVIWREKLWRED